MNETHLIHLKSFNRKEDALLWLGVNYIEGAFIELGSALKSIDNYGVSGKFNVVVEYEDLLKGIDTLKSIFKSPIQDIVDRYGGAQGSAAEGWVRQPGREFSRNVAPLASGGRVPAAATSITNQNLARLLGRATQGGTTAPTQATVPERLPSGAGVAPSVPMGPNTGAGTPNAFDLFRERSKTPTRNPGSSTSNAFDQYGESSAARNSGMGAWATGTSGRNPTGSSTSWGTSGVPTLELTKEGPMDKPQVQGNPSQSEEKKKRRWAGLWPLLLLAGGLLTADKGPDGNQKPPPEKPSIVREVESPTTPQITILDPNDPTTNPPAREMPPQRVNLFDTPTAKPPTPDTPATKTPAPTQPDKALVEKAVHMVIKSLIERGVIA